jgi:RNA polymerase sporulation-specific sigma factor
VARHTVLSGLADEALAARSQRGDRLALDTLIDRYRLFARAKARRYYLVGGDADDVEQEALIGLHKAVRDFRPEHQASFRAFAELCVRRQIITAIKMATRQKHQPLNQYVSISGAARTAEDAHERTLERLLMRHHGADPADGVLSGERMDALWADVSRLLSRLEVDVLALYVEGRSYQEIGVLLGRHVKSVDNAVQRIKRKLEIGLVSDDRQLAARVAS